MTNDFDITDIERLATDAIRDLGISANVWNNRPKATSDTIGDFVVVKVTGGITDKAAFGQTHIAVQLFARDVAEMKNSKKLSVMQKRLKNIRLWLEPDDPSQGHGLLIEGTPRVVGHTGTLGAQMRMIIRSVEQI